MATKKAVQKNASKPKSKTSPNEIKEVKSPQKPVKQKDPLARYIVAIVIFFMAIVLMIASISYFFTWEEDQSISTWSSFLIKEPQEAVNMAGRFGAVFTRIFIGDWFGIAGVLMPFLLVAVSGLLLGVRKQTLYKMSVSTLMLMIVGAVTASYFFPEYDGIFGSSLGGGIGYMLNGWLKEIFGDVGEGVVIFMLFSIVLVYISVDFVKRLLMLGVIAEGMVKRLAEKYGTPVKKTAKSGMQAMTPPAFEAASPETHRPMTLNDLYATSTEEGENHYFDKEAASAAYSNLYEPENLPLETMTEPDPNEDLEVVSNEEPSADLAVVEPDEPSEGYDFISSDALEEEETAIEATVIPPREASRFSAAQSEPKNAAIADADLPYGMSAADFVVFAPKVFDESGAVKRPSDDDFEFETYSKKAANFEEAKHDNAESPVVAPEKRGVLPEKESSGVEELLVARNDDFVIERRNSEDEFEVSVTNNAVIDVAQPEMLEGMNIKTNFNEELDDEQIDDSVYDPTKSLSNYKLPTIDLMDNHTRRVTVTEEELFENKNRIVETLENFNIKIDKIKATIGPTVTLYEIIPAPGVRISKIKNLEDDIALSLSALGIRIIAPIPGKGTIGIEVPNKDKEVVSMYSVIKGVKFQESDADLPIVLGRTIQNEDYVLDLAKTPHMLVAGATGQGKSVGLNAIITSLLYKKHPSELKFVFVDPKKVELTLYAHLERHFLAKLPGEDEAIITDTQKVIYTLNSLCSLMDTRYDILKTAKVRNIKEYNAKFVSRVLNPNKGHHFMPYFVVVIDEFADLIMTAGREIETPIARLAQLGRATGIHLVIATQRPTTNIITGVIKANFPTRVAFRVSSMIDSRTILDQPGANQLIGRGDMLISNGNDTTRVQCAFIDTPEVERITEFIGKQTGYGEAFELPEYVPDAGADKDMEVTGGITLRKDALFDEVARYVVTAQQGSASTIQRNFSIGFNRAGRIMDQLEKAGIVGRQEGSKPRQVLVSEISSLEVMLYEMERDA